MKKTAACLLAAAMTMTCIMPSFAETSDDASALNVGLTYSFTTLDPAINTELGNFYVLEHMYAGMFRKDSSGIAQPELCRSYEVSEDGKTYTFTLREDAVWSDGTPVTAYDFEYSYLRALSFGTDSAFAINDMVNLIVGAKDYNTAALEKGNDFDCTTEDHSSVGIQAVDDTTLVLTLTNPCAYLINLMCEMVWIPVPQSAPQHESLWAMEPGNITSGPYTLTYINEEEKACLEKSDSYFDADTITLDELNFYCIPDTEAEAMAFQTGEIDIALSVSTETASNYSGTDNLWSMSQCLNYFLAINSGENGPDWAKDVNVRRALALAIDKDTLAEVLGSDFYKPLNGYVPNGVAGAEKDFRAEGDEDGYTLTYNQEEALSLLTEAGYDESNPLKIDYKYANNGIHGDIAVMLEQMWSAIGVEVTLDSVEYGVYWDQIDNGDFEICRYGYSAGNSPMQFLELWTTEHQVVPAVSDETFDAMIEEARTISDSSDYYAALHEAEDYLVEDNVYVIPLLDLITAALVADGVSGYELHGTNPFFGYVTVE